MVATTIPVITEEDWARRFVENFPEPWTSEEAKEEGGALYALMFALGNALSNQMPGVEYDWKACRIETAVDDALDAVAKDFFGDVAGFPADVIRAPGEPDESLRARIQATLLLPAATRAAMIDMLKRLTGEEPRVMEPWSPNDTAVWNKQSFFNVDTKLNSARFGNPGRRGQGFVESPLPSFSKDQGTFPIYCFNKGACWNAPNTYFFRPQATWWLQIARIDALVNKTKVFGTKVWRKYTGQALTRTTLGGTTYLAGGEPSLTVEVFPPFAGSFVVLANCNWGAAVSYRVLANNRFVLVFSTPAPPGGLVDWVATPITVGGVGRGGISFDAVQSQIGILPAFQDRVLLVAPTWNTNVWLHSRSSSLATLKFSAPAPALAQLAYQFFPSNLGGSHIVPANSPSTTISIASRDPFQAFVLPTWNTSVDIDKTPTTLNLTFITPPDVDSFVYFGLHES